MNKNLLQLIPKFENLPSSLPIDGAVRLELEQGVIVFRATPLVIERIEELLEKQKEGSLTLEETNELNSYEEIDDYLSHVNRLIRNALESSEVNIAA